MSSLRAAAAFVLVALGACAGCSPRLNTSRSSDGPTPRARSRPTNASRSRQGVCRARRPHARRAVPRGGARAWRRSAAGSCRCCSACACARGAIAPPRSTRTSMSERTRTTRGSTPSQGSSTRSCRPRARARSAEHAVALDPASADAHIELARVLDAIGERSKQTRSDVSFSASPPLTHAARRFASPPSTCPAMSAEKTTRSTTRWHASLAHRRTVAAATR